MENKQGSKPVPPQADGSSSCLVFCEKCGSNRVGIQRFVPANYLPDGRGGRKPTVTHEALQTEHADDVLLQHALAYCADCLRKTDLVTAMDLPRSMKD